MTLKRTAVLFLLAGLFGIRCSKQNTAPQNGHQALLKFAFITCSVNAEFFKPVKRGMNDAAKMMNVDCEFMGTNGVDVRAQADMVRQAVRNGYDGIALNIIHPTAFDDVVQETMERGVPVVGFNVDDHTTPNSRLSSVNQQLYHAGEKLGRYLLPFIPEQAHVLMTMHDKGISALEDRLAGIQHALSAKHLYIDVIISGNVSRTGAQVISAYLKEHPEVKIIIGTGQSDTEAAGIAIEENFQNGYWSAGFDLSPKTLRLIKDGHIRCTVDQQPYIQGFYPVVQLAHYIRYGLQPSDIDAGAAIIDIENIDQVCKLVERGIR